MNEVEQRLTCMFYFSEYIPEAGAGRAAGGLSFSLCCAVYCCLFSLCGGSSRVKVGG